MKAANSLSFIFAVITLFCFSGQTRLQAGCPDEDYLAAEKMYQEGRKQASVKEKVEVLERAFNTCPSHGNHAEGYYELGKIYFEANEKEKAFKWLAQANKFRAALLDRSLGDLAQTNLLLGKLYKERGDAEKALIHLNIYRSLTKQESKEVSQYFIDNAESLFSVIYTPGTVKETLTVDKAVKRSHRAELNRIEVYFDFDKAELDDDAKRRLDAIGQGLQSKGFAGTSVVVEGHTDETGEDEYNCGLGKLRAEAATQYLGNRWGITHLTAVPISYGKSRPTIPRKGHAVKDRPKIDRFNRRVAVWNSGVETLAFKDIVVEFNQQTPCSQ